MGFILTFTACLLLLILAIPSIIVGSFISAFGFKLNDYWIDIAIGLDCLGNVICQHLFNLVLIKKGGHEFGNIKETVSSVLGKNYEAKTCTLIGLFFCNFLNKLDKNHVQDSIDNIV